jgi:hypothetical protein
MPYADPDRQREYMRKWMADRRAEWFAANGPCIDCGAWNDLQLDHVDAEAKVTHRVWSWTRVRREAELAKCVARCRSCHVRKTSAAQESPRAMRHPRSLLTTEQVREVRRRAEAGESQAALGREFGVSHKYVWELVHRRSRTYE